MRCGSSRCFAGDSVGGERRIHKQTDHLKQLPLNSLILTKKGESCSPLLNTDSKKLTSVFDWHTAAMKLNGDLTY